MDQEVADSNSAGYPGILQSYSFCKVLGGGGLVPSLWPPPRQNQTATSTAKAGALVADRLAIISITETDLRALRSPGSLVGDDGRCIKLNAKSLILLQEVWGEKLSKLLADIAITPAGV